MLLSLLSPSPHLPLSSSPPKTKPRVPLRLPKCSPNPSSPTPLPLMIDKTLSLASSLRILPPDSARRWEQLLASSGEAEAALSGIPYHLIQAVTASEDCRFFYHSGVDPFGIARAVVNFPKGGGGSTITQQLMKRVFLTSERKISRKFVEGFLSLMVEQRMSKWKILYSYLSEMYWGHGIFGIESASYFYFGKHPNFLTVGESALLAGILPSPERLNPYTCPRRGRPSQARVLRRMVAAGFIDIETALQVASQPLCLMNEIKVLGSPSR